MKKTVVIDEELHKKLKKYCEENNLKINNFINQILTDYIVLVEHESKLPNFLRDDKGSVVEMTVCSFVSNEYKKHLPKEVSLMRKVGDEGYVATYIQK